MPRREKMAAVVESTKVCVIAVWQISADVALCHAGCLKAAN
jgi:hypothetical protein